MSKDCDNKDNDSEPAPVVLELIPAQRLISNIVNAIFTIFPTIGKNMSKQHANQMLAAMNVSGMLQCNEGYIGKDAESRKRYAKYMIRYEVNIRSIARSFNIEEELAVMFMRCCFKANKTTNLYPYLSHADMIWPCYELLIAKFGECIAECIAETIIGVFSAKDIGERFPVFNRVSKKMVHASNASFFIIEGCNYVATLEEQTRERAPGQSNRIFIDEFIDYLREMDETRYFLFQDEIAELLINVNESFTPDCSHIISHHLNMERFDDDVTRIRKGFRKILNPKQPDEESMDQDHDLDETAPMPLPMLAAPIEKPTPLPSMFQLPISAMPAYPAGLPQPIGLPAMLTSPQMKMTFKQEPKFKHEPKLKTKSSNSDPDDSEAD